MSFVEAKTTKINNSSLLAPSELGEVTLYHTPGKFFISQNGKLHAIESYNTDTALKPLKEEHLDKFQQVAFFILTQLSDGEFVLRGHMRGKGGGPISAAIGAWLVRAAFYTPPALVGTAATVATAGGAMVAVPALGAASVAGVGAYIATAEGCSAAVAIALASCPFIP